MALAVGYPGWLHVVGCRLNIYTIPHVIFAAMVVVCIILMQVLFKAQPGEIVRTGQGMELRQPEQKEEQNGKQKVFFNWKGDDSNSYNSKIYVSYKAKSNHKSNELVLINEDFRK